MRKKITCFLLYLIPCLAFSLCDSSATYFSNLPDNVTITNNLTVANNATISGDLTVSGTASFTHSDNLDIADKFITLKPSALAFSALEEFSLSPTTNSFAPESFKLRA